MLAVSATIGLATAGAIATRNLGASNTGVKSAVQAPAAALPLRQDNDYPVIAAQAGTSRSAVVHKGRMGGPIDSSGGATAVEQVAVDQRARMGGPIDSSVGFTADENGPDSDLTRALPASGPIELPLWLQKEMGTSHQSSGQIVIDQSYIDQYLTSNPGWDARSVREGHGL